MALLGKTALVVGGGRGIGAAVARLLAAQGATVAVSFRSNGNAAERLSSEVKEAGGKIAVYQSDAHDPRQVEELVRDVHESTGRLDIVVHSAPGVGVIAPILSLSWEQFIRPTQSKLSAAYALSRAALPVMKERQYGRMVFITSGWAKQPTMPGLTALGASFGAEISFVRSLAHEMGPHGITINAVAPGMVETELSSSIPPEARKSVIAMTPIGRIATPTDVAQVVLFLCTEESGFMTGTYVPVNGGMSME